MDIHKYKSIGKGFIFSKTIFPAVGALLLATQTGCSSSVRSLGMNSNNNVENPVHNYASISRGYRIPHQAIIQCNKDVIQRNKEAIEQIKFLTQKHDNTPTTLKQYQEIIELLEKNNMVLENNNQVSTPPPLPPKPLRPLLQAKGLEKRNQVPPPPPLPPLPLKPLLQAKDYKPNKLKIKDGNTSSNGGNAALINELKNKFQNRNQHNLPLQRASSALNSGYDASGFNNSDSKERSLQDKASSNNTILSYAKPPILIPSQLSNKQPDAIMTEGVFHMFKKAGDPFDNPCEDILDNPFKSMLDGIVDDVRKDMRNRLKDLEENRSVSVDTKKKKLTYQESDK